MVKKRGHSFVIHFFPLFWGETKGSFGPDAIMCSIIMCNYASIIVECFYTQPLILM